MKYLSDHARIVILEKRLERLATVVTANIVGSGCTADCIGQVGEDTPVNPIKVPEILTTMGLWENPADEEIVRMSETAALKQDLQCSFNRLRNPKEVS